MTVTKSLDSIRQSPLGRRFNHDQKRQLSELLVLVAETLDITPTQFEEARKRYEAVGNWLDAENSLIKKFNPQILPQGSFRIGTVIKPLSDADEFDVDLVCLLNISLSDITQHDLKKVVGDRLKANEIYKRLLAEEKRRCWTLEYAESTRFHMDILPSITDPEYMVLLEYGVPYEYAKKAILITDNKEKGYYTYEIDWPKSNPIGYASWFVDRMGEIYLEEKKKLLYDIRASVEELQAARVRTPLQRSIQLLKRHRDLMYGNDDDKPISIIITTLAAKAYEQEENVVDSLAGFFQRTADFLYNNSLEEITEIPNPVDPRENFADKWLETPRKKEIFFKWFSQAYKDLVMFNDLSDFVQIGENLKSSLGENIVGKALNKYGDIARTKRESGILKVSSAGTLSDKGTQIPKHQFYGD